MKGQAVIIQQQAWKVPEKLWKNKEYGKKMIIP